MTLTTPFGTTTINYYVVGGHACWWGGLQYTATGDNLPDGTPLTCSHYDPPEQVSVNAAVAFSISCGSSPSIQVAVSHSWLVFGTTTGGVDTDNSSFFWGTSSPQTFSATPVVSSNKFCPSTACFGGTCTYYRQAYRWPGLFYPGASGVLAPGGGASVVTVADSGSTCSPIFAKWTALSTRLTSINSTSTIINVNGDYTLSP